MPSSLFVSSATSCGMLSLDTKWETCTSASSIGASSKPITCVASITGVALISSEHITASSVISFIVSPDSSSSARLVTAGLSLLSSSTFSPFASFVSNICFSMDDAA
uniref:Uncharacterized protein n=1 Tax=Rhizophora mucronata TaxID=61149 RepID=A0A2P2MSY3_RHIMU